MSCRPGMNVDRLERRYLFAAPVPLPTPYGLDWRDVSSVTLSYNGSAWFTGSALNATSTGSNTGLYRSDGTRATFMDALPMLADASFSAAAPPVLAAGKMFMLVNAKSLYVTDGTPGGTRAISSTVADNNTAWAQVFNDRVYYRQKNGTTIDLYMTDGTTAGTKRLTSGLADPYVIGSANGWVYFKQSNGHGAFAVSRTDGNTTEAVATIAAGSPEGVQHFRGNQVLFTVRGYRTNRLWVSDNTAAGTRPLDSTLVVVETPRILNGIAYFLADDGTGKVSYYRTDGTFNGTYAIRSSSVTTNYPYYPPILQSAYFGSNLYLGGQSTGSDPILMISPDGTVQALDAKVNGTMFFEGNRLWLGGVSQYVTLDAPTTVIQTDGNGGARTADGHYVYTFRDGGNNPRIYTWDSTTAQVPTGSVSGTVYSDDNGDNTRTSADPALRNTVTVYADLNDNGLFDTGEPSTPGGPSFFLDNVPAGTWTIAVAAQPGLSAPAGPLTRVTVISRSSTANISLLASYKSRLSGIVFNDANANGLQDSGEGFLSGVKVFITADPAATAPLATDKYAFTDSSGRYLITEVTPGGYLRAVLPTTSYVRTTSAIDLSALPANFVGVTEASPIGLQSPGRVQFDFAADTNSDGLITSADASITGLNVPFYVDLDNSGTYTTGDLSSLAADEGILGGIPAGTQTVRAILPQGWSSNWAGGSFTVQVPGGGATVRLPQLVLTPAATTAVLSGRVAVDDNFDRTVTTADTGVPLLTLWADGDSNATRALTESYTFSKSDGSYVFDALPTGTTRLAFTSTSYSTLANATYVDVNPATSPARNIPLYARTQQVRLSGTVRFDANNDGLVDANDPPLAGVTIVSAQGISFSTPVTTDASGRYVAYAVASTLSPTIANLPGYTVVTPATPTALAVGDSKDDFNLLVKGPTSTLRRVSGRVYQDLNFNGTQDTDEPPLAGLTVFADYDLNGRRGATEPLAVTAADGSYTLSGLFASNVSIVPLPTAPMAVTNFVAGKVTVNLSLTDAANLDFGIGKAAPATISVYRDVDNDGVRSTYDVAVSATRVWADLDSNGVYDASIDATAVQTTVGSYTLGNLPPDRAVSVYADYPGATFVSANPIVLSAAGAGTTRTGAFAVKTSSAAIAGRVYMDYNENGQADSNEASTIGSVTLRNASTGTVVGTTSILSDATFRFPTVAAGTYQLTYTPAAGFEGRENAGGVTVTVGAGEFSNSTVFGFYYPRVTITGHVALDTGTRGEYDGDAPIAGVRAFIDTDGDFILDPGEQIAVSDASGTYTFTGIRYLQGSGYHNYIVVQNPSQMVRTGPYSIYPYIETWNGGDVGVTLFAPPTGTLITGYVFKDLNTNGVRDPGEPGIPRQTVATDLGTTYANSTLSDHEGFYAYTPLWEGGTFDLTPVLPTKWISTDPQLASSRTVTVAGNGRVDNVNFGFVDFQIGGRLFVDLNGNGKLDGSETPIAGRRVWIDADGDNSFDDGERSTTSDADGFFAFANTGGGQFHLVQDKPANEPGAATVDVTVLSGGATGGITFGGQRTASPAAFTLDDGTGQFSMVRTITVTLDAALTAAGVPASAFSLVRAGRPGDGFTPSVLSITPLSSGRTAIVLAFSGPDMAGGSLGNGRYTLSVDGSRLTDTSGRPVDAAGNATPGSSASLTFNRLYGDYNASGRVDFNDFLWLQNSMGATRGRGDYIAALDGNSDGVIDFNDFLALQNNFGMSV